MKDPGNDEPYACDMCDRLESEILDLRDKLRILTDEQDRLTKELTERTQQLQHATEV